MKLLSAVPLTPEQIPLLQNIRPGAMLIRGAAGSGKTTTALMRLRQLCEAWRVRRKQQDLPGPVRVLVLTFNTTLQGYIQALADAQIGAGADLELVVSTFGKFAKAIVPQAALRPDDCDILLRGLCRRFGDANGVDFVLSEVDYVLGRLDPDDLNDYLTIERRGRGVAPRIERAWKQRLLDEVIRPYFAAKKELGWSDWNDLAVLARSADSPAWDVVVIDETQDFSANQLRAVVAHLAEPHQLTLVMDAAQRIYPRYFSWTEAGITLASNHLLRSNYRNTKEIAAFARPLLEGLPADDNAALPDFASARSSGEKPFVLSGVYGAQLAWAMDNVVAPAAVHGESVAFLKPRGGRWFDTITRRLDSDGLSWADLTRQREWPDGDENIAISTLHSAKGLEFDHVIILGLSAEVTPHGSETGDTTFETLRRLLAMGIGRARISVTIGSKPGEASDLVDLFHAGTFTKMQL